MTVPKWLSVSLCAAAALLADLAGARAQVTITSVGNPLYQIVDARLFAAPQGSPDNFSLFNQTVAAVLPNHFPRVPHAGPYDQEISEGLVRAGFADRTSNPLFDVSEFAGPTGVFFGLVRVPGPNAPIGSSFDFASGPIIPNSAFPIITRGDVFRNGEIVEANAFGPATSNPAVGFDGNSHNISVFAENGLFLPTVTDLTGDYEYRISYRDTAGVGYDVSARFQVVPEPSVGALVAVGLLPLVGVVARRRAQRRS